MRIAILGVLGFIGKHLSQHLIAKNHEITGFVLNPPVRKVVGMRFESVSNLLRSDRSSYNKFDVSINLAARRSTKTFSLSPEDVSEFTFSIPKEFFLRTASAHSLAINISTYIQNFQGILGNTKESYGAAKQKLSEFLELKSQDSVFRTLDLYLFTVYGRGDHQSHLVPTLIDGARKGITIDLSPGHQLMNLIHVQDVVENLTQALTFISSENYIRHNLWSDEYFTVRNLVSKIEEATKSRINCNWGARNYVGHEMLNPWPIPMDLLPGFSAKVPLRTGIKDLWNFPT